LLPDAENATQFGDGPPQATVDTYRADRAVLSHRPEPQRLLRSVQVVRRFMGRKAGASLAFKRRVLNNFECHVNHVDVVDDMAIKSGANGTERPPPPFITGLNARGRRSLPA
jgi:hypothetical protein